MNVNFKFYLKPLTSVKKKGYNVLRLRYRNPYTKKDTQKSIKYFELLDKEFVGEMITDERNHILNNIKLD